MTKDKAEAACLEANQKEQRGEHDIFVYSYQNDGGFFYIYKNETGDQVLKETLTYEISGLEIETDG